MTIKKECRDLFTVPQGYYLAHCISGDYTLGAGIAKQFDDIYNMRYKLHKIYPIPEGEKFANVGKALLVDNVFNLVTKERYFHKPTYDSLYDTLVTMCDYCVAYDITKIAMPLIGCGLDKLDWDKVEDIIEDVFENTNLEILVCSLL
jgi:O-acetyl-ADP-ribose deacetylase (regulator of RNase III)